MIYDNATNFAGLKELLRSAYGIKALRTARKSPWQNGFAERWFRSARQELLRHVIVLSKKHLHRLLEEYVEYYNDERTHYSLGKDTPMKRPILYRASDDDTVIALPRLSGLHHKYIWKKAA